jgi:hypothetical protein
MAKIKKSVRDKIQKSYEPSESDIITLQEYREGDRLSREWQNNIYEKLQRYYYLYRGVQEESEYPWRNNICLPIQRLRLFCQELFLINLKLA